MKKRFLYYSVLSLFLLIPASITRAQETKTLNGTVRYKSGMSEIKFSTPNGDVVVDLPLGAVITCTVSTEPAGKTEKEKKRNLKELLKYAVMLDGQKIPLSATPSTFDWLTHQDRNIRMPMELLNVSGAKVAEVSLPPVRSAPATINSANAPKLTTPSCVLVKGDAMNIYTDQHFSPGEKFVVTDSRGQQFTVKPRCLSSEQAVFMLPNEVAPGELTVTQEVWNQPISKYNVSKAKCILMDIFLSSPNTNLRPGENSFVMAKCSVDDAHFTNYCIDLRNLNPNIVTMEGGNIQRVYAVNQHPGAFIENDFVQEIYQITRNITGNAVGSFSVSATLHEDYNTSNDPFRPQLNVLKTPEDFNAWANALKKDMKEYAGIQNNDAAGQAIKSNAQRAIDNMPVCKIPEQLDESKAVAYSLVQPLHVPKGAAISWLSSYEAAKAAARAIENTLAGNTELIDYDVLKNGTEFINRVGGQLKDASLQTQCSNVQQLIDNIQTTSETKENLQDLKNKLDALQSSANTKMGPDVYSYFKPVLKDIVLASYQLPSLARPGEVHPYNDLIGFLNPEKKTLYVLSEYRSIVLSMIHAQPLANGQYHINSMTASLTPVAYDISVVLCGAQPNLSPGLPGISREQFFDIADKSEPSKEKVSKFNPLETPLTIGGTQYKIYEDAKCTEDKAPWKAETCLPEEKCIYDPKPNNPSPYRWEPTGKYDKREEKGRRTCKKGEGLCIEIYQVVHIQKLYEDEKCSKLIETINTYKFKCE